jgi:hypothetical protein
VPQRNHKCKGGFYVACYTECKWEVVRVGGRARDEAMGQGALVSVDRLEYFCKRARKPSVPAHLSSYPTKRQRWGPVGVQCSTAGFIEWQTGHRLKHGHVMTLLCIACYTSANLYYSVGYVSSEKKSSKHVDMCIKDSLLFAL